MKLRKRTRQTIRVIAERTVKHIIADQPDREKSPLKPCQFTARSLAIWRKIKPASASQALARLRARGYVERAGRQAHGEFLWVATEKLLEETFPSYVPIPVTTNPTGTSEETAQVTSHTHDVSADDPVATHPDDVGISGAVKMAIGEAIVAVIAKQQGDIKTLRRKRGRIPENMAVELRENGLEIAVLREKIKNLVQEKYDLEQEIKLSMNYKSRYDTAKCEVKSLKDKIVEIHNELSKFKHRADPYNKTFNFAEVARGLEKLGIVIDGGKQ